MSRRRAAFTQDDVMRTVRGLIAAGVKVTGARVDAGGFTILTTPQTEAAAPGAAKNAADVVMDRLRKMAEEDGVCENTLLPH